VGRSHVQNCNQPAPMLFLGETGLSLKKPKRATMASPTRRKRHEVMLWKIGRNTLSASGSPLSSFRKCQDVTMRAPTNGGMTNKAYEIEVSDKRNAAFVGVIPTTDAFNP